MQSWLSKRFGLALHLSSLNLPGWSWEHLQLFLGSLGLNLPWAWWAWTYDPKGWNLGGLWLWVVCLQMWGFEVSPPICRYWVAWLRLEVSPPVCRYWVAWLGFEVSPPICWCLVIWLGFEVSPPICWCLVIWLAFESFPPICWC